MCHALSRMKPYLNDFESIARMGVSGNLTLSDADKNQQLLALLSSPTLLAPYGSTFGLGALLSTSREGSLRPKHVGRESFL
jgi:hypothetical protein